MKKLLLLLSMSAVALFGGSEAAYPADWQSYSSVGTTLTHIGALPGCDADVSSLPEIYRETVATYCNVKPGGPGAVAVLVKSDSVDTYTKRDGQFSDGDTMILHLKEIKALFVTQYSGGKPLYGIFTEEGTDIAAAAGSGLNPQDCRVCHTGYGAFCTNGQCGTLK